MKDEKIIKKALKKAEKNGFDLFIDPKWIAEEKGRIIQLIFMHNFAKAFWGNKSIRFCDCSINWKSKYSPRFIDAWQYHLQRLVLCEEPLLYLEKFL